MVWRKGYTTQIRQHIPLTGPVSDGVYLGLYDVAQLQNLGVWIRLFEQAAVEFVVLFIAETSSESLISDLMAPSLFRKTRLIPASPINTDRSSFAAVVREGRAKIVMIGPPTEEAWDAFLAVAKPD